MGKFLKMRKTEIGRLDGSGVAEVGVDKDGSEKIKLKKNSEYVTRYRERERDRTEEGE